MPETVPQTQLAPGAPPAVFPVHEAPKVPTPSYYRPFEAGRVTHERYVPGELKKRLAEDRSFRRAVIAQAEKQRRGRQRPLEEPSNGG